MNERIEPTMSLAGYLVDTPMQMARIMSDYLLTDGLQSTACPEQVFSISVNYFKYIREPELFAEAVRNDIDTLFRRRYPQVESDAKVKIKENGDASVFIFVSIVDVNNRRYGLGGLSALDPKGFGKVLKVVNEYSQGLKDFNREY